MTSPFALSQRRKRLLLRLVEPALRAVYALYRLISGEAFRDHRLPHSGIEPSPRRILVVRLDTIGDVLLSEPAITALAVAFPDATVDAVVSPSGAQVLANHPHLHRLFVYEAPWHAVWRGARLRWTETAGELWRTIRALRRRRYDLGVELRGDLRDIAFLAATGARVKVGNGWRGGGFLLEQDAPMDPDAHRVDFALGIVRSVGANLTHEAPCLHLPSAAERRADEVLQQSATQPAPIAFHLGAGFASKCLPVDRFARVANRLASQSGTPLLLVGGADERDLADRFLGLVRPPVTDLVGRLSVPETAAVLGRCRLFIGNDSGPMHLAAAMGVPVVTFFGPSEPHKYHPYGVSYRLLEADLPCRPCDHVHCVFNGERRYLCMQLIEEEEIVRSAQELLSGQAISAIGLAARSPALNGDQVVAPPHGSVLHADEDGLDG